MIHNGGCYSGKRQVKLLGAFALDLVAVLLGNRHTHVFHSSGPFIPPKLTQNLTRARLFSAHHRESGWSPW